MLGDRVRLSWTPPPPDGLGPLTFAIMRKRGGLPEHPGDGTRIAEVSTCEFDDRHVKPGETVSYAVLGKRGEAESLAAVAAGPVVYLPDVQDVRVEPREGEVELSWIPPHGVFEIRVVRKLGAPPADPATATGIAASLDQALDRDLERGPGLSLRHLRHLPDVRRPAVPLARRRGRGDSPVACPAPAGPPADARSGRTRSGSTGSSRPRGSVRILRTTRPLP